METKIPKLAEGAPTAPPLEVNGQEPASPAHAEGSASQSAPLFGGLRGGRKRLDGLVPGSPEAIEADKKKERERKAKYRAQLKIEDPPALPSALPVVEGAPQTVGLPQGAVPAVVVSGAVPWVASKLGPLFRRLISTAEKVLSYQITSRARKASLPSGLVKEIEIEAKWSDMSKEALQEALPELAAKYLNKTGISAEYQPEIVAAIAVSDIAMGHLQILQRLDRLIELQSPAQPKTTETKPVEKAA